MMNSVPSSDSGTPSSKPRSQGSSGDYPARSTGTDTTNGWGVSRWWVVALILGLVVAAAHGRAVRDAWLLDDVRLVRGAPSIVAGASGITDLMARPTPAGVFEPATYRPLAMTSLALNRAVNRDVPVDSKGTWIYVINLVLYTLCGLVLALLLYRVLRFRQPVYEHAGRHVAIAVVSAIVFLAHPLIAEPLSRAVGRADVLAALFVLLSLFLWQRVRSGEIAWLPVLALSWFAALLSHEAVLLLPVAVLLLDPWLAPRAAKGPWLEAMVYLLPTILYFLMGGMVPRTLPGIAEAPWIDHLLVGVDGWWTNVLSWWVPSRVPVDASHALPIASHPVYSYGAIACGAAIALIALLGLTLSRSSKVAARIRFALGVAVWGVAVACCMPTGAAHGPRFAMLGLLPLAAVVAGLLAACAGSARRPWVVVVPVALVVASLVWLSRNQHAAFANDASTMTYVLEEDPLETGAIARLVRHHRLAANETRNAMSELSIVARPSRDTRKNPLMPFEEGYARQQLETELRHHVTQARAWAKHLERVPEANELPDMVRERGLLMLERSRTAEALQLLKRAATLDPLLKQSKGRIQAAVGTPRARLTAEMLRGIGRCHVALGQGKDAIEPYSFAVELDPTSVRGLLEAGAALVKHGAVQKGLDAFEQARRSAKTPAERGRIQERIRLQRTSARVAARVELNLGTRAVDKGDQKDALLHFKRAIEIDPTYPKALLEAGWITGHWFGKYQEAHALLDRAESLLVKDGSPTAMKQLDSVRERRALLIDQKREEDAEERREIERESRNASDSDKNK